jgi:hypothetical protein
MDDRQPPSGSLLDVRQKGGEVASICVQFLGVLKLFEVSLSELRVEVGSVEVEETLAVRVGQRALA